MTLLLIVKIFVCFAIGAISFAKLAMLGTGLDITRIGSGNPGFNNVLRAARLHGIGRWRAGVALVGDIGKGFVALLLFGGGEATTFQWAMGISAVMGHCWSPFLGWNGGKGVATTVGVLLYLDPVLTVACLPLYPALRWMGRRVKWRQEGAIASLTTMFVLAVAVYAVRGSQAGILAFVMFAIVLLRHSSNLKEIFGGKGGVAEKVR